MHQENNYSDKNKYIWILAWCIIATIMANSGLGSAGSIAAIVSTAILVGSVLYLWWKSQNVSRMHLPDNKRTLRLQKGKQANVRIRLYLKEPTVPMGIRFTPSLSLWKRILRFFSRWDGTNEPNAKDDCGLEIQNVLNKTWEQYRSGPEVKPSPGRDPKVFWNLGSGGNDPPIPAPGPIELELVLLPYGNWLGDIEFSGTVKGHRYFVRRRVEVMG
jgi:hypothetical protein